MGRKWLIYLVFYFYAAPSVSQQVFFKSYTVQEGLVANPVRCIYQDKDGFIWIGTFEGLSRFDGYRFTNYTNNNGLTHNFINAIYQADQELLIAENNGAIDAINRQGIRNKFLLNSAVNGITQVDGHILFSTDTSGLFDLQNDKLTHRQQKWSSSAFGHILPYNDSLLLIDGVDNNLMFYTKDLAEWKVVRSKGIYFYFLFRDSKNRIWVGTSEGLKLIPSSVQKEQPFQLRPLPSGFRFNPLLKAQVNCMVEEKNGGFWIGTNKGLVHLDSDLRVQVYNEKDGLPSATINTLYFDRENNLWIGTSLGLAKWISENNVAFFNIESLPFRNDIGSGVMVKEGKIVLNTTHGLQFFDFAKKQFHDLTTADKNGVPVANAWPLQIASNHWISIFDEHLQKVATQIKVPNGLDVIYSAIRHPSGKVFFGTAHGLFSLSGTSFKKLLPHRITYLAMDKTDRLWIGTWADGLYYLQLSKDMEQSNQLVNLSELGPFKEIRSLFCDRQNNIWVGTRYAGVFCLTPQPNQQFKKQQFNRNTGLMSDWIQSFAELPEGNMWVGSYLGLDRLVKEQGHYRVFNFSKATNFFAQIQGIYAAGNNNWICQANSGLAYFHDEALHIKPPLHPKILSAHFGFGDQRITITSSASNLILGFNQNAARFEFSAPSFINEKQVLFSYRLKGSKDTTWSKAENIHEASYVSLAPGSYTFEVRNIGYNEQAGLPEQFSFTIRSPFWMRWWFFAFCILLLAFIFYSLYRYRIRQLLQVQKVRNSIATDLHDDIGSTLTNINILSELSHRHLEEPEKAQTFLNRISQEVQSSSQAMDDIIWSVNARNDSLPETMARMRRYAAELFDNSKVTCYLQLDETSQKKLSMEQRRDLYLIYKEVLNNIYKHAHASCIWIDVFQSQNQLHMRIRDNGNGFDMTRETHRNGLKNLRARVSKWKGNITIYSAPGDGTEIYLHISLRD